MPDNSQDSGNDRVINGMTGEKVAPREHDSDGAALGAAPIDMRRGETSGGPRWFLGSEQGIAGLARFLDVIAFGGCATILFTTASTSR